MAIWPSGHGDGSLTIWAQGWLSGRQGVAGASAFALVPALRDLEFPGSSQNSRDLQTGTSAKALAPATKIPEKRLLIPDACH